MGYYINPPRAVIREGRSLANGTFSELKHSLKEGEALFGLYDRGFFENAPWLHSHGEMAEFEEQVWSGAIRRIGFYAVPIVKANELGACIPEE